jgi:hypothetical protein
MNSLRRTLCAAALLLLASAVTVASTSSVAPDRAKDIASEIACAEYQFSLQGDGSISAPNRAQDLRSSFSGNGLHIESRTRGAEAWSLDLRLTHFGREKALSTVVAAVPQVDKERVTLPRQGISEWYLNGPKGLEQGFDVAARPATGAGRLAIQMLVTSRLAGRAEEDGRAIRFLSAEGKEVLRYGALKVVDALGTELQAELELQGHDLRILVDDEAAAYPLHVDPLVTSPAWTASGDQAFVELGFSVASAGDVNGDGYADLIVGVPFYDNGQVDEGRVFVYHGSATGPGSANWQNEINNAGAQYGFSVASAGDVNGDG